MDDHQLNATYGGDRLDSIQGAHRDGSMAEAMVVGPLESGSCVQPSEHGQKATDGIGI